MNSDKKENLNEDQKAQCKFLYEKHVDILHAASKSFDKAVLGLATASLGFTFAFIELIKTKNIMPNAFSLLIITWVFLIISLVCMLASLIAEQKHCVIMIKKYDSLLHGSYVSNSTNCITTIMKMGPILSSFSFIFGIIFFTIFAGINLH